MPGSLIAFLESTDYESAVRKAIALGGDADTLACIAGGVAQAFYGAVPEQIAREIRSRLPEGFLDVLDRFERRYGSANASPRTMKRAGCRPERRESYRLRGKTPAGRGGIRAMTGLTGGKPCSAHRHQTGDFNEVEAINQGLSNAIVAQTR